MLRTLDRAGKLSKLNGLIVGGFTDIKEENPSFGYFIEEIILTVVAKYNYPIIFDFPTEQIEDK